MINYSVRGKENGAIEFWTDNEELKREVMGFISIVTDAASWRNRVERLACPPIRDEEGEV